jgi:hypothetical protein
MSWFINIDNLVVDIENIEDLQDMRRVFYVASKKLGELQYIDKYERRHNV